MKRPHLFEWEDFEWFPDTIRDLMTDYLRHVVILFKTYEPAVPILNKVLEETGTHTIIDLASGAGGPWQMLAPAFQKNNPDLKIVLTDLYPNTRALRSVQKAAPDMIDVREKPVNAVQDPDDLQGLRAQFLSLHHFKPQQDRKIFENAISTRQPIAVFEFQQRTPGKALAGN